MDKKLIEEAYGPFFWNQVKNVVDSEGWVYTNEVPHNLHYQFRERTSKSIVFINSIVFVHTTNYRRGHKWRPWCLGPWTSERVMWGTYERVKTSKGYI